MKILVIPIQLIFAFFLLLGIQSIGDHFKSEKKVFFPPPKGILNFTLGYSDYLSSLFWVRVAQDLEVCDQTDAETGPRSELEFGIDPIQAVIDQKISAPKCTDGWVYQMIDLVTELDKKFQAAYRIGGTFLSVLVDDRDGAQKIYDKGTERFPKDWQLLYFSASHYLFELKKPKKAAVLLEQAGANGAPVWVYSLAAGLYSRMGRAQFAKGLLKSVLDRDPKGPLAYRLKHRLAEIEKVLAEKKSQ